MVCESTFFKPWLDMETTLNGISFSYLPIQVDVMNLLKLSAAVKVGGGEGKKDDHYVAVF